MEVEHRDLDVLRWSLCELDVSATETVADIYEQVRKGLQSALDSGLLRAIRDMEPDGHCFGDRHKGMRGRKTPVFGHLTRSDRIYIRVIADASSATLPPVY